MCTYKIQPSLPAAAISLDPPLLQNQILQIVVVVRVAEELLGQVALALGVPLQDLLELGELPPGYRRLLDQAGAGMPDHPVRRGRHVQPVRDHIVPILDDDIDKLEFLWGAGLHQPVVRDRDGLARRTVRAVESHHDQLVGLGADLGVKFLRGFYDYC